MTLPGLTVKKYPLSINGEWYVDQVTFPGNIPEETFKIPEGLDSFDVAERDDYYTAIRHRKTATHSQRLEQGIKKIFISWQGTAIWIFGISLCCIIGALLFKYKPWRMK